MLALNDDDLLTSEHRGHGQAIAKRNRFEWHDGNHKIYWYLQRGKVARISLTWTLALTVSLVVVWAGIAVGARLSNEKTNGIVVCFFGDSATNGVF